MGKLSKREQQACYDSLMAEIKECRAKMPKIREMEKQIAMQRTILNSAKEILETSDDPAAKLVVAAITKWNK